MHLRINCQNAALTLSLLPHMPKPIIFEAGHVCVFFIAAF